MFRNLIQSWWGFVIQGVLAIIVGVAAFLVPGPTLAAFLAVFAVYAILTGAFELVAGFRMDGGPKWSLVIAGVAGIAVGVLTIATPGATAVAVTLLVGIYAIVTGVGRTAAAYMLRGAGQTWLLAISGVVSVVFGVLLIANPNAGVLGVLFLIGWYAIFTGITTVAFGLRLRGLGKTVSEVEAKLTASGTTGATASNS